MKEIELSKTNLAATQVEEVKVDPAHDIVVELTELELPRVEVNRDSKLVPQTPKVRENRETREMPVEDILVELS